MMGYYRGLMLVYNLLLFFEIVRLVVVYVICDTDRSKNLTASIVMITILVVSLIIQVMYLNFFKFHRVPLNQRLLKYFVVDHYKSNSVLLIQVFFPSINIYI